MFLNKYFQRFYEIDQKLLNATRHAYHLSKMKLLKLNEKNEFSFEFNVVDDDDDVEIDLSDFQSFNAFKKNSLKMTLSKNCRRNHDDTLK